jgi:hypothetical protein
VLHAPVGDAFEYGFDLGMPGSGAEFAVYLVGQFFLAHAAKKGDEAIAWMVDFAQRLGQVATVVLFPSLERLLQE